MKLKD
ncbi:hypothetical protein F383_17396 [Gossypium arboreum]|jgi:hypothetical protein